MRTNIQEAEVGLFSQKSDEILPQHMYTFDCGGLRDPIGQPGLRNLFGTNPAVKTWIRDDPRIDMLIRAVKELVADKMSSTDRKWISISFRDKHARLISPAVVEIVADVLDAAGYKVHTDHYAEPKLLPRTL